MRWIVGFVAIATAVAGGAIVVQRVDRERQYRRLLAEGEQALLAGNPYAAIEDFSGAIALRPDAMAAYYRRGEAYRADHHDDWAIRDLREASRLAPDAAQPLVALGEVYDAKDDPIEAARWYGEAADRLKDETPALLYALALARYRAGAPAAAIDPLKRAIERNDSVAQTYYLLGLVYRDTNKIDAAIEALEQATKIAPTLTPAREELADIYRAQGRFADESAQLQALAALDENADRHVAIALAAARRGQFDAALTALSEAEADSPNDARLQLVRGRIYVARAERTLDSEWARRALEPLERALSSHSHRSEGLALFGRALFLAGDYTGAERILREAVSTSPVDREAFGFLADASERLGQVLSARDALVSLDALEGDTVAPPTRASRARRIGVLSLRGGDAKSAARYLDEAIDAGDSDVATQGLLADAYWRAGDADSAKTTLAAALARDPQNVGLVRLSRTIK
ncbi:MAG TPA: tetratricopeptide repeat protein [Vicinamibacterales bacterium]|nr:tetratricopeptide repeat protein [Vicinamibacterales bacterium]